MTPPVATSLLTVVTVDVTAAAPTPGAAVVDPIVALMARLRTLLTADPPQGRRVAVVVVAGAAPRAPLVEAAVQAVRGAALSVAVEIGDRTRVNVVVAARADDAQEAIAYLAEPDADYVTASTFDLVGAPA